MVKYHDNSWYIWANYNSLTWILGPAMGMIPVRPARPAPKIRAPCRRPTRNSRRSHLFLVQNPGKNVENGKSHWKNTNWIWKWRWKWKGIHTNWWKMAKMDGNECKNTNHGVRWAEFHSNSNSEWWKSPWTNRRWWLFIGEYKKGIWWMARLGKSVVLSGISDPVPKFDVNLRYGYSGKWLHVHRIFNDLQVKKCPAFWLPTPLFRNFWNQAPQEFTIWSSLWRTYPVWIYVYFLQTTFSSSIQNRKHKNSMVTAKHRPKPWV